MSKFYKVTLNLSSAEVERVYRGDAQRIVAKLCDGRSIQFPARVLRSIVGKDGVQGVFVLEVDERGKFLGVTRK